MSTGKRILSLLGVAAIAAGSFEAGRVMPHGTPLAITHIPSSFVIKKAKWTPAPSTAQSPWTTEPTTSNPAPASSVPSTTQSGTINVDSPSSNWAGMVQLGTSEQSVQASWTAPGFSQAAQPGSSIAEWIGLGGAQSSQLIQVGTITTANNQGSAQTSVFWEKLPGSAVQTATIPTGSSVTAQIVPAGNDQWRLILYVKGSATPLIDKLVFLSPRHAQAVQTSADWITEVPTGNNGLDSLAPVSSTVMTNVKANNTPLKSMNPNSLQTIGLYGNGGQLLAAPVSDSSSTSQITVQTVYGNLPNATSQNPEPGWGYSNGYGAGSGWVQVQTSYPSNGWSNALPGSVTYEW